MTSAKTDDQLIQITRLILLIFIALAVIGAVSPRGHTQVSMPAIKVGDYNGSCKDFHKDAFFDIGLGKCFQCPSKAPKRSVFDVEGGKYDGARACFKPASTDYERAIKKGKAKGVMRNKCPEGQYLWVGKGRCYTCPSGYKKTGLISSRRACSKKTRKDYEPAISHGERGCPANSWRHGLTDSCYRCPEDTIRNAKFGKPDEIDACTYYRTNDMAERFDRERYDDVETQENMSEADQDWQAGFAACAQDVRQMPECLDGVRRNGMLALLNLERELGSGFTTVTWSKSFGASGIVGVEGSKAYAMHMNDAGEVSCIEAATLSPSVGWQNGADYSESFTLSPGGLDSVPGSATGYTYGGIGSFWGLEWDDETGAKSMTYGLSLGVEFSAAVLKSGTMTGDIVDCETLSW